MSSGHTAHWPIVHRQSLRRRRDASPSPSRILMRQIQNRVKAGQKPSGLDPAPDLPCEPKMRAKGSREGPRLLTRIN
jgi:hypothetical protein